MASTQKIKRSSSVSSEEESPNKKHQPERSYGSVAGVVYSQPADTGRGLHLNTKLTYAVGALKDRKGLPTRAEDIALSANWEELSWDTELQEILKKHERVVWDSRTGLFSYKADHNISTPAQLLQTIKANKDKSGGVAVKSLKESWTGTQQVLDELIEKGDVLPMRPKKDAPYKTVFWNEVDLERGGKAVDKEFKDAWHALKVPIDVEKALKERGIKPAMFDGADGPSTTGQKKKGKKTGSRKVKITNTHMTSLGVDFTKDRVVEE